MSIVLIAIYIDSFAFVFFTAILTKGFNLNVLGICRGTIVLCEYATPFLETSDLQVQAWFST